MSIHFHESFSFEGFSFTNVLSYHGAVIHASHLTLDNFLNF